MGGGYDIPAIQPLVGVFTNKFPTDAIRGAGRPEATHRIELTMDGSRDELDMDPLEVRRKNFIPKDDFPHRRRSASPTTPATTTARSTSCSSTSTCEAFRREQARAARAGHLPRRRASRPTSRSAGLRRRAWSARRASACRAASGSRRMVRVQPSGTATVYTGTSPHGQGHETSFAQIAADRLGIDPDEVDVIHGDTAPGPVRLGHLRRRARWRWAARRSRARRKGAGEGEADRAALLEAAPEDIELVDGKFQVRGLARQGDDDGGDRRRGVHPAAGAADGHRARAGGDVRSTTRRTSSSRSGRTRCVVEVDPETGKVEVVRYVAVDDCGPAINPMLIDGQVHGGVVHAIGQALYEQVVYDEHGPAGDRHVRGLRAARRRRRYRASRPTAPRPPRRPTRSASRASARRGRSPARRR